MDSGYVILPSGILVPPSVVVRGEDGEPKFVVEQYFYEVFQPDFYGRSFLPQGVLIWHDHG
jgi:hypothetical protein